MGRTSRLNPRRAVRKSVIRKWRDRDLRRQRNDRDQLARDDIRKRLLTEKLDDHLYLSRKNKLSSLDEESWAGEGKE
jgi:hypothetical protein